MGTAGAVAQHAALSMQRLLQSPISDEAGPSQMLVNCAFLSGTAGLLHKNSLSDHLATVRCSQANHLHEAVMYIPLLWDAYQLAALS